MSMGQLEALQTLLASDSARMAALTGVAALELPDCWIGAGFIRDAVWDHLHGRPSTFPAGDVDVIWFAPEMSDGQVDRDIERGLGDRLPKFRWSVKNQARMHRRNGDAPYGSAADAMRHWPETATAVAARLDGNGIGICAPCGLDDLFALRLRPTPAFAGKKRAIFQERLSSKRWAERYPLLSITGG